jgi:molybdopterin-guanine dinucleotide biosynthesis protein A
MMTRVTRQLSTCHQPVLTSAGAADATGTALIDDPGVAGPIAGLAAAVRHLRERADAGDVLVSVAVDTPFLPDDYVARLTAPLDTVPGAFAIWKDNFYPTNAAFRLAAIADLPERAADHGSPRGLLGALGAVAVRWPGDRPDPFASLNTLADLVALARRAA